MLKTLAYSVFPKTVQFIHVDYNESICITKPCTWLVVETIGYSAFPKTLQAAQLDCGENSCLISQTVHLDYGEST